MNKKIKFSLQVNGRQLRSLEELEDNFQVQDMLKLHRKGILARWLTAHGFDEKTLALAAVTVSPEPDHASDIETARKLAALFCPALSPEEVRDGMHYLFFLTEEQAELERLKRLEMERDEVINEYHSGYGELKKSIQDNFHDLPFLSEAARTLVKRFWQLVELDMQDFITTMFAKAPCLFLSLLGLGKFRDGDTDIQVRTRTTLHIASYINIYHNPKEKGVILPNLVYGGNNIPDGPTTEIKEVNWAGLKILQRTTHESWDDIVPEPSKRIMIVYLAPGNFVRGRKDRQEISADEANNNFPILEGLDYKGLKDEPLIYFDVTELRAEEKTGGGS